MKRLLDIFGAVVLLVLFLPVGVLIAIVLAFTGEGEVLFDQPRVGKHGRRFKLLKFATMRADNPHTTNTPVTLANDPRVLPVGRLLRKTKLNELPQLINVLLGDMSLVGPRPLPPEVFAFYPPEVQRRLLDVSPGVTGLGSIAFRDEERIFAQSHRSPADCWREEIAPRKGRLELWYIEHRSLSLDLRLLLLTIVAVLAPRSRLHERVTEELGP